MKSIIGFRTWYENDKVYDSKSTTWKELPDDGLIVVILYENKRLRSDDGYYRRILSNKSFYWVMPDNPLDVFYDDENPTKRYPGAIIKLGKWVDYDQYEAVTVTAMETIEL